MHRPHFTFASPLAALGFIATSAVSTQPAHAQVNPHPPGEPLAQVRTVNLAEDSPQGYTLLGAGIGSIVTGGTLGLVPGVGNRARYTGLNMIVWGAINTVIAIPWVLGLDRERRAIAADREHTGDRLAAVYRDRIAHSESQSRSFLINAALDVIYIGGGAALWYGFDRQPAVTTANFYNDPDFWAGAGIAALTQGAFLMIFDLVGYCFAEQRTERLRNLRIDEAHAP